VNVPRPSARRVDAAQRDARALELRAAGLSFRQIAQQLGVSVGAAHKAVTRGLDRTLQEPADRLRRLERERLDRLQLAAGAVLRARHVVIQGGKPVIDPVTGRPYTDHAPALNAIRTLIAIAERRAKLDGLDAPTKVDANVSLQVAWERASPQEHITLLDADIRRLEEELARNGPPTPPAAETIAAEPDEELLAEALAAGLDAAGVDLDDAAVDRLAAGVEGYLHRRNGGRP
jgi:hypothetical protein